MSTTSRMIASLSLAAALAVLSTSPASSDHSPDEPGGRVGRAVTAAPDADWAIEVTTLAVTPAPPPPPPLQRTPEQIAVERATIAATYDNGTIPEDVLCELSFAPGQLLRCDAHLALENAYAAGMPGSSMSDSYRSLEGQVAVASSRPSLAAVPGTSQHGLGLAVDVSGRMQAWLHEHGAEFGWVNPAWAKTSRYEPWHFEYVGDLDSSDRTTGSTIPTTPEPSLRTGS